MDNPGTGNADRLGSVQRLSYRSPVLVVYGSVSKLTEGTAVTANGDTGQNMMTSPCL
jgi:hypothetical protein